MVDKEVMLELLQEKRTVKELSELLHCNYRNVSKNIERLRLRGYPICSSWKGGYWLGTKEEFRESIIDVYSKIETYRILAERMERTLEEM